MTPPVDVEWCGYDERREQLTANDTDAAIDILQRIDGAGSPVLVDFVRPDGRSLTIGVGRDQAVMCFQSSHDGPNFASVGEDAVGTTHFSYGGEESEFYRRQLVPKADAQMALREFLTNGERPTCVEWEEV